MFSNKTYSIISLSYTIRVPESFDSDLADIPLDWGMGEEYCQFFLLHRRFRPSIYCYTQKILGISGIPKKIFPFSTLTLKNNPKNKLTREIFFFCLKKMLGFRAGVHKMLSE